MKHKLKEYIDIVFADTERRAPGNRQVAELKEEILQNLYEKYDDLIAKGKTPASAYNIAVAGVGDISELLDSVSGHAETTAQKETGKGNIYANTARPLTPEEQEITKKYKARSAVLTSVAVALYILCWVPLAILGALLDDLGGFIGLPIMFLMIACATAMMVYNGMTKPKFDGNTAWDKDDDDDDNDDDDDGDRHHGHASHRPRRSPVYGAISGALWVLTIGGYFLVSYVTGAWHITWLIFLIATALDNVIKALFDLRR